MRTYICGICSHKGIRPDQNQKPGIQHVETARGQKVQKVQKEIIYLLVMNTITLSYSDVTAIIMIKALERLLSSALVMIMIEPCL